MYVALWRCLRLLKRGNFDVPRKNAVYALSKCRSPCFSGTLDTSERKEVSSCRFNAVSRLSVSG